MRTLVIAGVGLLGSRLADMAEDRGWTVRLMHRVAEPADHVRVDKRGREHAQWNPGRGVVPSAALAGADAVACLNGAPIAPHPWTTARRELLRTSRVGSVHTMAQAMAKLPVTDRPKAFISGSAIGFYGDGGDRILSETAGWRSGFLPQLCQQWEAAADPARIAGVRVVHPRMAVVVAAEGGLGAFLHHLYRWGLGARLGTGNNWQSYVSLDDAAAALLWMATQDTLEGPCNVTIPTPIRHADFHRYLSGAYSWRSVLVVPHLFLPFAGAMGRELIAVSQRAVPQALTDSGFVFTSPTLPQIWRDVFGVEGPS